MQIQTVEDMLAGAKVKVPPASTMFKKAQRDEDAGPVQGTLGL